MNRVLDFLLGAFVGGITAVCIFALCVGVCTAIRPAKGLDEISLIFLGAVAAIILGPLIGGIVWVRRARRRRNPAQPGAESVTKPD